MVIKFVNSDHGIHGYIIAVLPVLIIGVYVQLCFHFDRECVSVILLN